MAHSAILMRLDDDECALTKDIRVLPSDLKTTMTSPPWHFYDGEGSLGHPFTRFKFMLAHLCSQFTKAFVMGFLMLLALFALSARALYFGSWSPYPSVMVEPVGLQRSWAQYSPFFPVKRYDGPPPHCKVIQVQVCL